MRFVRSVEGVLGAADLWCIRVLQIEKTYSIKEGRGTNQLVDGRPRWGPMNINDARLFLAFERSKNMAACIGCNPNSQQCRSVGLSVD